MSMGAEGSDQDFDLNIAPIIDCFTVLIAYLLISASFVSIGFFDVGVSTTSEVPTTSIPPGPPPESMSIGLKDGQGIEIRLAGPEKANLLVPARAGARDYAGLVAEVRKVRERWPGLGEASVSGEAAIEYREIVRTIEALKQEIPKVFVAE